MPIHSKYINKKNMFVVITPWHKKLFSEKKSNPRNKKILTYLERDNILTLQPLFCWRWFDGLHNILLKCLGIKNTDFVSTIAGIFRVFCFFFYIPCFRQDNIIATCMKPIIQKKNRLYFIVHWYSLSLSRICLFISFGVWMFTKI